MNKKKVLFFILLQSISSGILVSLSFSYSNNFIVNLFVSLYIVITFVLLIKKIKSLSKKNEIK